MSYGYHRAEIIGAITSVLLIWGLTVWLLYEATLRLINPPEVDAQLMVIISVIGLVINLLKMLVLNGNHDHGDGGHEHGNE